MTEPIVPPEALDALLAESAGPYLRTYVAARLAEAGGDARSLDAVLEELYVGLLACDAFVSQGEVRGVFTRLYALVDAALPHLLRPALRRPADPALQERARRFVALVAEQWHGGHAAHLAALQALPAREREAVLLRDFHALSMHEIAQRLGLEREVARALVTTARDRARAAG
jgi:DNA-directed RNA polymerase specialized sigma24 family protein